MKHQPNTALHPVARIQENVLASSERRLLIWLCGRTPAWVTPDLLTAAGMVGAAAIFIGYAASSFDADWLWLAVGGYLLQWFGDSMDGNLARYRKIERPSYGYFLDHSCDGLATLLILAGMGLSPFVRLDVALLTLAGYLLLSVHAYISVHVIGELKLSYLAAGPTELRLVLVTLTFAMMLFGASPWAFESLSGFDVFVGGAGLVLILLFVLQTLATARRLALVEPVRPPAARLR